MNRHWTLVCVFAIAALALTATGAAAQDFGWDHNGGARWQPGPEHNPGRQPEAIHTRPAGPPPPPLFRHPPVAWRPPAPCPPPVVFRPPMPRWAPPPVSPRDAYRAGLEQGFREGYIQGTHNRR